MGPGPVALRKESVDRNDMHSSVMGFCPWSLSARRAWIEIAMTSQISVTTVSLSARRAWIEIRIQAAYQLSIHKSLSARRAWIEIAIIILSMQNLSSRSPQGERG